MEVVYTDRAEQELKEWVNSGNKQIRKKIIALIQSILETPFTGIGKPEQLKHNRAGYWSRRITDEHRLVYKVEHNKIIIIQLKFHYN
ncbi:Txe/YoeB family addiction module toxin [Pedobacter changchengzhani]|uniref:Putative mRNA interferase YoeB n=1 Tax=Pedobacter changchengzhani TaxID=2529274 RepID=A0A4R5MJ70_9SPHI|nr:Txe/YoeB family addiction module toxin [Pedobacter changchengzhani]TDG35687.1 Txe/YoeB family addiction module toxin [Pedobacter changchengzhani]